MLGRMVVRIVTLNVWARHGDWRARCAAIAEEFLELRPDLVALQETVVLDGYDQVRELLGPELHVLHQRNRHPDGTGISVASRWPIVRAREIDQHITDRVGDFPATTVIAEVAVPGPIGRLLFVNHFPSFQPPYERERELQTVAAARSIDEMAASSAHVVVAGDLDADPDAASIRFWSGRQSLDGVSVCYRDAWAARHRLADASGDTHTARNPLMAKRDWPFSRIDYVFVRCDGHGEPTLQITNSAVVFDQPRDGVWPSDHFGVLADVEARQ